jgi:hypothetical protein
MSQIIRRREGLVIYKSFNTLWAGNTEKRKKINRQRKRVRPERSSEQTETQSRNAWPRRNQKKETKYVMFKF